MNKDLVSVVVPAYNSAETIGSVLLNVIEQTYRPFEIIIVDDGSSDKTAEIVHDIINKENVHQNFEIKYIYQKNSGPSKARNTGIKASKGKYIAFLDADDFWEKEKIKKQVTLFEKEPTLDVIFSDSKIIRYKNGKVLKFSLFAEKKLSSTFFGHDYILTNPTEKLLTQNFITTPSLIAKKSCFINDFFFNEERWYMEDWELWLKMSMYYNFGYIKDACVNVIDEGDGLHSDYFNMSVSQINMFEEFISSNRQKIFSSNSKKKISKIIKDHYKWGGYFFMMNKNYKRAQDLYKKALKEKMDLKVIVYYLKSFVLQHFNIR